MTQQPWPRDNARAIAHRERLDRFAELLSLDIPLPRIAERMCIHYNQAHRYLTELRAKYGWQAA